MMENRAVMIQKGDSVYHMSHYTDMFDPCVITNH